MSREIKSNRTADFPDKDLLDSWRRNLVTQQIWKRLSNSYNPVQGLRDCSIEKIEYYRGQLDMLDELSKLFTASNG